MSDMDELTRKIFAEFASDSKNISEYYERVLATYGEEQLKEAVTIYESNRYKRQAERICHEPILTIRVLGRLLPRYGPYKISVQNAILLSQLLLLALSVIFPPFNFELPGGADSNAGYHFISSPPETQHVTMNPTQIYKIAGRVDILVLLVEWALIFTFGVAARKLLLKRSSP